MPRGTNLKKSAKPKKEEKVEERPEEKVITIEDSNVDEVKESPKEGHKAKHHSEDIDEKDLFESAEKVNELTEEPLVESDSDDSRKTATTTRTAERKAFNDEMKSKALTRLKFLLEKTSLYSTFLSQKVQISKPTPAEPEEEEENPKKKRRKNTKQKVEINATIPSEEEVKGIDNNLLPIIPQPKMITGVQMRDYQLQGAGWLISLYENGLNGILADEMGLGKTVQCISLFAHLIANNVSGPFLVVAPLSTIGNWMKEIARFAPKMTSLMYHGTKEEREQIRLKQMKKGLPSVIVTSYQIVMIDRRYLNKYQWKYIVVDEGHRLKNMNCQLIRELKSYHSANRLLLTGTPLQNNLLELWSMLNFLLPDIFDDVDSFQSLFDFSSIHNKESGGKEILEEEERNQIVQKLHSILRPFLLRRLKQDVALELPPKYEKVVLVPLTEVQKTYYKAILSGTLESILSAASVKRLRNSGSSLQNKLMQLRKACNHPYLFEWPEDKDENEVVDEEMIRSSGKLVVLDRLLTRLKKEGHRVLIFSQMTRVLDIIEAYCDMKGHGYRRIDGVTPQQEREESMKDFYKDEELFVFLLSTRAGGLGINLTCADTVIFYDNDWNPQMDLQAQDRAHRIGQTKPVMVYRLASSNTIESLILDRQNSKMKLEDIVIRQGNFLGARSESSISGLKDLEKILLNANNEEIGQIDGTIPDEFLFGWTDKERKM
ncbi:helicase-like protein [Planoprotostelium fungivorum]|uniref:Helicase-like protein n=1 Tax=Planoprotostelium fungivorum TaxID=1890364 RepID=A0A2P6NVW2_9EUKA|nr:helicase-like protein [Planoprotostelium fungivorum]